MEQATRSLVEIAAAVAAGCTTCLDQHLEDARRAGVSEADIAEAMALAEASRRPEVEVGSGDCGCGCGCGS
jgi:AhpD family alkylhydroperoxidase